MYPQAFATKFPVANGAMVVCSLAVLVMGTAILFYDTFVGFVAAAKALVFPSKTSGTDADGFTIAGNGPKDGSSSNTLSGQPSSKKIVV